MNKKILLDGRELEYELTRKRVKNINLRVHSDGRISVSANSRVSVETIERFMVSKASFILRALDKYDAMRENAPKENDFIDKGSVRLFDKSLTLVVLQGSKNHASINGDEIILTVKNTDDPELRRVVIEELLKNELMKKIYDALPSVYGRFKGRGIEMPQFKVRKMKSRWGSCNYVKGVVTLNLKLTEYPYECLELVLAHELAHLVYPDHSRDFYELLSSVMPDWKARKQLLK